MDKKWFKLTGLIGCAVLMVACNQTQQGIAGGGYATMITSKTDVAYENEFSATVRGRQDIDIYPQVSGRIMKLCVTEGERVRKGQILFIIDQVPYQAALRTAEANVKAATASLKTAELNYNSGKELYEQKVISLVNLQTIENTYLAAEASLAQAEASLVNAKNDLSYTEVSAPCDGVVGEIPYRVGTLVSSSMAEPLTTVSDNSSMYVYFSMTENRMIELVRRFGSTKAAIDTIPPISLRLNDGSIFEEKGKFETVSGVVDRSTGTVQARAVFPNPRLVLHSGSSGTIIIPAEYPDVIVIPQGATIQYQDQVLVYKVIDGKAVSSKIEVSDINDGRNYIVLSGLEVGEEIVSEGAGLLREGTQVK